MAAYALAVETGDAPGLYHVGRELGVVLCHLGKENEGLALLKTALQVER